MTASFDTIYIHPGLAKCGSSYLQNAFCILEQRGALMNTTYPKIMNTDKFEAHYGGNLAPLHKQLEKNRHDSKIEDTWRQLLSHANHTKRNILLSREGLLQLPPDQLKRLEQLLLKYCNRIVILVVVRPFAEYVYSLYCQGVQRKDYQFNFESWLTHGAESFEKRLFDRGTKHFKSLIESGIEYEIIPYSKTQLLEDFLPQIGESALIADQLPKATVNRSLTQNEQHLYKILRDKTKNRDLLTAVKNALHTTRSGHNAFQINPNTEKRIREQLPIIFNALNGMKHFDTLKNIFGAETPITNNGSSMFSEKEDFADIARIMLQAIKDYRQPLSWRDKLNIFFFKRRAAKLS